MKSSLDTYVLGLGLSVALLLIVTCPTVVFSGRLPTATAPPVPVTDQNSVVLQELGSSSELLEIEPEPESTTEPEPESESLIELEDQLPDFQPQTQPVKRSNSNSVRFCGGRLVKVVRDFCHGNVFPGYSNRVPASNRVEGVGDLREKAAEITQECCFKSCALKDLTKYCGTVNGVNAGDST